MTGEPSPSDATVHATVVNIRGSAPRPVGASMRIHGDGTFDGSVSGGCVENDVILHAAEVAASGKPRLVSYGIADEDAFAVGLSCGGTIQVFLATEADTTPPPPGHTAATLVSGPDAGSRAVLDAAGRVVTGSLPDSIADDVATDASRLLAVERSATLRYGDVDVFFEPFPAPPHALVFGAGHVAQPLVRLAKDLGFGVTVADARAAFATPDRFPDADAVLVGWPDQVLEQVAIDDRTYVVVLSHDARFEDPLLPSVLAGPAPYVGAIGSRKTHAARVERLAAMGVEQEQIDRLHAPIGIDIGSTTPEEIALAIVAEMTKVRRAERRSVELAGALTPID